MLDQMWFQQIIAAYYVLVDAVLVTQFMWYGLVQRVGILEKVLVEQIVEGISIAGNENSEDDEEDRRPSQNGTDPKRKRTDDIQQVPGNVPRRNKMPSLAHTVFITISLLSALAGALPVDDVQALAIPSSLPSLGDIPERLVSKELIEAIGMAVGWVSTLLYVVTTSPYLPHIP